MIGLDKGDSTNPMLALFELVFPKSKQEVSETCQYHTPSKNCIQFFTEANAGDKDFYYRINYDYLGADYHEVPHECYATLYSPKDRCIITTLMTALPLVLFFFEVLHYRVFSEFFDKHFKPSADEGYHRWIIRNLIKATGNFMTILGT